VVVGRWDYSCATTTTCGGKAALLKLDASGNIVWQKTYGGLGDRASAVQATADGGYVVAGSTTSFGAGNSDAWVLKLDASGNILWQKTYGGELYDTAYAVQATADGGYVVAGQWDFSGSCNSCGGKAALLKLDAGGNVVWQKASGLDHLISVQPTADGGYVATGEQRNLYVFAPEGAVLKLDANGAIAGCDAVRTSNESSADSSATTQDGTAAVGDMSISPISFMPTVANTAVVPQQQCYDPSPASRLTAVEYYYGGYGHYFVTAFPAEIAALDSGRFPGWTRTGESFQVYGLDPGAASVCRFWSGQTFAPKSSHFYTPDVAECTYRKQEGVWQYEGDVFALVPPDATGNCGSGTVPLYRLYNNGQTGAPNHRYTTSLTTRADMLAQGWLAEGSGIGVIGCVPPGAPASVTVESPTLSPWVGETMQLTAMARDASGAVIAGTTATWSSSNPAAATISAAGVLQGMATGSVVITATIEGVSGTQSLMVTSMPRIGVTIGATKDRVFDYTTDRCYDMDLPDLPTHVVRAEDGSLVLFAGNAPRFYVSRGADFGSFQRDCTRPVLESADRRTPESYENWEWISAVYREGNRWHALISNEFHDAVASTCKPGDPSPSNPCWYNSATYAVSTDGAHSFSKPFAPAHVVAPPPYVWEPPLPGASPNSGWQFLEGYFAPISIVSKGDGFFYGAVGLIPSKANPPTYEMCLIRTDNLDDPSSWRAWDGSGFNVRMTSPYVTGSPAAPLCKLSHEPPGSNITFNTYLDRYMEVGNYRHTTLDGKPLCGVFFSLSADLFHWSAQQLIAEVRDDGWCPFDLQKPGLLEPVNVMYFTLIDHADTTVNFERPGRTPYLYYVRFNRDVNDPAYWLDRDLVRVPLAFTRLD
jgi:hypothetical protein